MPRNVEEANGQKWERMNSIARAYVRHYVTSAQKLKEMPWSKNEAERSLRPIAAGCYVLARREEETLRSEATQLTRKDVDFLRDANDYMTKISPYAGIGTLQDYDMVLNKLTTLLYAFVDEPNAFSNNMVWSIICQCAQRERARGGCGCRDEHRNPISGAVATFSGKELHQKANVEILLFGGTTIAETENHVLMIHSWQYLVNNYVRWVGAELHTLHPRYDRRIKTLYATDPDRYHNEGSDLENLILQALGRILHNGMFEENARPYEELFMHGIMNLYLGADALFSTSNTRRIKTAAQNAMEFLIAKYAFQSFEGKRGAPFRRNYEYRRTYGVGNSDYMIDIVSMLSGAYVFNDDINDETGNSRYCWRTVQGNGPAYALWTALFMGATGYELPESIHDFLLDKHQGYWARLNTFFTQEHYPWRNHPAKYFLSENVSLVREDKGKLSVSPEFYFCAPGFLNSAGGRGVQYYPRNPAMTTETNVYNFISVPYTVIPRGDVGRFWGREGDDVGRMKGEILVMRGSPEYPHENRKFFTYKNFSYRYICKKDAERDYHLRWLQEYPSAWDALPTPKRKREFSVGRARFRLLDLRRDHAFYVVLARVSKQKDEGQLRNYARGFWEIVPGGKCGSLSALEHRVKDYNPPSHFPNYWTGPAPRFQTKGKTHYRYKLAVSGETLEVDQYAGSTATHRGIGRIWDYLGRELPLMSVHIDYGNEEGRKHLPLLEVSEVDENFQFTGKKYATNPKPGLIIIENPFVGKRLVLDSRNILDPKHGLRICDRKNSARLWQDRFTARPYRRRTRMSGRLAYVIHLSSHCPTGIVC